MAKELTLMAVGDIFIGTPDDYPRVHNPVFRIVPMTKERPDLFSWLEDVAPILQHGAFVMGNLEGPVCERAEVDGSKAGTGSAAFKMPPAAALALKRAGFSALGLANNHIMDFGQAGLLQTIENLDSVGISRAGGGRNIAEARRPAILERDGVRLAFLSYTSSFVPGTSPAGASKAGLATVTISTAYEPPSNIRYAPGAPPRIITTADRRDAEQMQEDVQKAKTQADLVVVSWHWGLTRYANAFGMGISIDEAPFFVLNYQEDMGRAAIDAGADLVMGHHPHRLQGMELYKGKLICYSLCNLVMSFAEGANFGPESVILKGYIDPERKQISRFTFVPIVLPEETMQPHRVPIGQAGNYVTHLTQLSQKYGTKFEIEGDEIAIRAP